VADAKAKKERKRIRTFENSLLKSAFYLYFAGIGVVIFFLLCKFVVWVFLLVIPYMIHYFYKFVELKHHL